MRNITVSIPDDCYTRARVWADSATPLSPPWSATSLRPCPESRAPSRPSPSPPNPLPPHPYPNAEVFTVKL